MFGGLVREARFLCALFGMVRRVRDARPDSKKTIVQEIERTASRFPGKTAVFFEDRRISYRELVGLSNRYARWGKAAGIEKGEVVALLMENRPEFIGAWLGLIRIGAVVAFMNSSQAGQALAHSFNISGARRLVLGAELADAFETARAHLVSEVEVWATGSKVAGANDLDARLAREHRRALPPRQRAGLTGADRCFLVFTSGATGLPKAAVITHARALLSMRAFASAARARPRDRMYIVLPLYHTSGGLCAVGTALTTGGSVILRRRFSVQSFWHDCVKYRATLVQYIGELCRYLGNAPEHPLERKHRLRLMIGNGLRPEVWGPFQERFAIPHIIEFYAATEGNVNLFNFSGRVGAVGRIPPYLKHQFHVRLIKLHIESGTPVRNERGFCVECKPGEPGEAIGDVNLKPHSRFEGYTNTEESEKKILRNVFKKGDAWFRTGDLLRQDRQGYFYFVDRLGDTYRWKGENVATSEVSQVIAAFPGIREAVVYGVKVTPFEGRAGMAAVVADEDIDTDALSLHLSSSLSPYARPVFLRFVRALEITGTFKHRKTDLVGEGIDPTKIEDPIYVLDASEGRYIPLDVERHTALMKGDIRL